MLAAGEGQQLTKLRPSPRLAAVCIASRARGSFGSSKRLKVSALPPMIINKQYMALLLLYLLVQLRIAPPSSDSTGAVGAIAARVEGTPADEGSPAERPICASGAPPSPPSSSGASATSQEAST